ncbi:MAG TPA: phosphoribosylformylglycinamidine cyclo-ligase [Spirochaetota bacterium]|nr:phosphoribosylformylglycinamidine cyclo-ligase [Spirochaetota bacterium]
MAITYKDSGVDVEGGNRFVKKIAPFVRSTFTPDVLADIGGFGSLYAANFKEMDEPVLVSGTDGVGTKLRIAQMMNKHDTIGIDAVAMCVNDIITSGAKPLFFLDYISCGSLKGDTLVDVVKGIAQGCLESGCSLVGGETAEHPGIMKDDEYDIAGFAVGVVDKKKIINGERILAGDVIIGVPSSGVHSNGFSLVRKLLLEIRQYRLDQHIEALGGRLGDVLLTPTKLYAKALLGCINAGADVKGVVHITGGGFYENIPRILPDTVSVKIEKKSYPMLPVFDLLKKEGNIAEREMYTTFNMGIGLMLFCDRKHADLVIRTMKANGNDAYIIGETVASGGDRVVLS